MGKYDLPKYDDWRKWIQRKREKGIAWPQIFLACKNDVQGLASFLKTRAEEDDFPALTIEEWYELVEEIKEYVVTEPKDIREWVQRIVPTYSIQEHK